MVSVFAMLACTTVYESNTSVLLQACCGLTDATQDSGDGTTPGDDSGTPVDSADTGASTPWQPAPLETGIVTDTDCTSSGPPLTLAPDVLWSWPPEGSTESRVQVAMTPVVAPLFDTDGDGVVSALDVPQVAFTAFSGTNLSVPQGALIVLDGLDGSERMLVTNFVNHHGEVEPIGPRAGIALGDLDGEFGDGRPEVCVAGIVSAIVCFTATTTADGVTLDYRWSADAGPDMATLYVLPRGNPAIADFDGDGRAEVALGDHVWTSDGALVSSSNGAYGGGPIGGFGVIAPYEVDGDGPMELVSGRGVFDVDVTGPNDALKWSEYFGAGYPAVADMDGDGRVDVASIRDARMYMNVGATGASTAGWPGTTILTPYEGYGHSAPPVIADFDGDGRPELAICVLDRLSEGARLMIFDATSELIANVALPDGMYGMTGFDFEGDGRTELIGTGGDELYIFGYIDGAWVNRLEGVTVGWDPREHQGYGHDATNVAVANVDQVGGAEVIVPNAVSAAPGAGEPVTRGIVVLHSGTDPWMPARPVWNQHAYTITNVNDDATIPAVATPNVEIYNNFRVADNAGVPSMYVPNVGAGATDFDPADCAQGVVLLYVPVTNTGANVAVNLEVRAVNDAGGAISAVVPSLAPGASTYVTFSLTPEAWGSALTILVDPDDTLDECDPDGTGNVVNVGGWPCAGR